MLLIRWSLLLLLSLLIWILHIGKIVVRLIAIYGTAATSNHLLRYQRHSLLWFCDSIRGILNWSHRLSLGDLLLSPTRFFVSCPLLLRESKLFLLLIKSWMKSCVISRTLRVRVNNYTWSSSLRKIRSTSMMIRLRSED
jgi:hypothetical protein